MKFITEEDLRDLYRKAPFDSYELEPGTRLTPGARQYLVDKGILTDFDDFGTAKKAEASKQQVEPTIPEKCWRRSRLAARMKSIEALFLLSEEELLKRDVCLAQGVIELRNQLTSIRNSVCGKGIAQSLTCNACTGINSDNFSTCLEDCFEITEFHVQLEKGRQLILLHRLRTELQEIEPLVQELYQGAKNLNEMQEQVVEKVNQLINRLSQHICSVFGGNKCQRQG